MRHAFVFSKPTLNLTLNPFADVRTPAAARMKGVGFKGKNTVKAKQCEFV
jgi:hypothetical protein